MEEKRNHHTTQSGTPEDKKVIVRKSGNSGRKPNSSGRKPTDSRKKHKKSHTGTLVFWSVFVIFVVSMAIFWVNAMSYVKGCLNVYEASQPEHLVEDTVEELETGAADSMLSFDTLHNRFEDSDLYQQEYLKKITNAKLTYKKAADSYDALAPVYYVYKDDEKVAEITLKSIKSEQLMFILAVQTWRVEAIKPLYETRSNDITIQIPSNYQAYINGILLEDTERTDKVVTDEKFQYAAAYTPVPSIVEYQVSGLYNVPEVKIYDQQNQEIAFEETDNKIVIDTYPTAEMSEEMKNYVLTNAINYSNFFSVDLPGCSGSIDPIRYMLPADSYYLELAENYRNNDMWMYSPHEAPVFTNQQVTNYIPYTDSFFTCDVYFEKSMLLTKTGDTRVDITNTRYYYVLVDGCWVIADMESILDK